MADIETLRAQLEVAGLAQFQAGMRSASNATDDAAGKINRSSASTGGGFMTALSGATALGIGVGIVGAGITRTFVGGISTAIDFEHAITQVSASLGGVGTASGITQEQFAALNEEALRIGATTTLSASESAAAFDILAKAGVKVTDILGDAENGIVGFGQAAVNLAEATGSSLDSSAEGIATVANLFNKDFASGALNAADATDVYTAALNSSSTDMTDFNAGLRNLGPQAANLGMSFQETGAAIAYFTNFGLKGADVGVSLARAIDMISAPTEDAAAAMQQYGIDAFDAQGKFIGFPALMDQVQTGFAGVGDESRLAALKLIFGAEAADVMNIAMSEGGQGLRDMIATLAPTGQAAEQAAARLDSTAGALDQLKGALEVAKISLMSGFLPAIKFAADLLSTLVTAFLGLPGPVQTGITMMLGLAGVILTAVGAFIAFGPSVMAGVASLSALSPAVLAVLGPIALVVAAVAGLALAYRTNFLGFADGANAVAVVIARAFLDLISPITDFIDRFHAGFDGVVGAVDEVTTAFSGFSQAADPVASAFGRAGDAMETFGGAVDHVRGPISSVERVLNGLSFALRSVGGGDIGWINSLANAFDGAAQFVGRFTDKWNELTGGVLSPETMALWESLGASIENVGEPVNRLRAFFTALSTALRGINKGAKFFTTIANSIDFTVASVDSLTAGFRFFNRVTDPLNAALSALQLTFPRLTGVLGPLQAGINALVDGFRFFNAYTDPVNAALSALQLAFPRLSAVLRPVQEAFNNVVGAVVSVIDHFDRLRYIGLDPLTAAIRSLQQVFPAFTASFEAIGAVVRSVGEVFAGLRDAITAAFTGDWDGVFAGLRDAVTALGSVIADQFRAMFTVASDVVEAINWSALGGMLRTGVLAAFGAIGAITGWALDVGLPTVGGWLATVATSAVAWVQSYLPAAGTKIGELLDWVLDVGVPTATGWLTGGAGAVKGWIEGKLGIGGGGDSPDGIPTGGTQLTWGGWALNVAAPTVAGWITGGAGAVLSWVKGKLGLGGGDTGQGQPDAASVGGGAQLNFGSWVLNVGLPTVGGWIKGGATAVVDLIKGFLPTAGTKLGDIAGWIMDVAIPNVGGWLLTAYSTVATFVQGFLPGAGAKLGDIAGWIMDVAMPNVGGWLLTAYATVKDLIQGFIPAAGATLGNVAGWILDVATPEISTPWEAEGFTAWLRAQAGFGDIDMSSDTPMAVTPPGVTIAAPVVTDEGAGVDGGESWYESWWNDTTGAVDEFFNNLAVGDQTGWGERAVDVIFGAIAAPFIGAGLGAGGKDWPDVILGGIQTQWDRTLGAAEGIFNASRDISGGALSRVADGFLTVRDAIEDLTGVDLLGWVDDLVAGWDKITGGIDSAIDSLLEWTGLQPSGPEDPTAPPTQTPPTEGQGNFDETGMTDAERNDAWTRAHQDSLVNPSLHTNTPGRPNNPPPTGGFTDMIISSVRNIDTEGASQVISQKMQTVAMAGVAAFKTAASGFAKTAIPSPDTGGFRKSIDGLPPTVKALAGQVGGTATGMLRAPDASPFRKTVGDLPSSVSAIGSLVAGTGTGSVRAPLTDAFKGAVDRLPDSVRTLGGSISGFSMGKIASPETSGALAAIKGVKDALDSIKEAASGAGAAAAAAFSNGGNTPPPTKGGPATPATPAAPATPDFSGAIAAGAAAAAAFTMQMAAIGTASQTAKANIGGAFTGLPVLAIPPVQALAMAVGASFTGLQTQATLASQTTQAGVVAALTTMGLGGIAQTGTLKTGVGTNFTAMQGDATNRATGMGASVLGQFSGMNTGGVAQAAGLKTGVGTNFNSMQTGSISTANALNSGVSGAFGGMKTTGTGHAAGLSSGTLGSMAGMKSGSIGAANETQGGVVNALSAMKSGGAAQASAMMGMVSGNISNSGAPGAAYSIGLNIGSSLASGLAAMAGAVGAAAANLIAQADGAMNKAAQINSPSKVFRATGQNVGGSVGIGVDDMVKTVAASAANLVNTAAVAARSALTRQTGGLTAAQAAAAIASTQNRPLRTDGPTTSGLGGYGTALQDLKTTIGGLADKFKLPSLLPIGTMISNLLGKNLPLNQLAAALTPITAAADKLYQANIGNKDVVNAYYQVANQLKWAGRALSDGMSEQTFGLVHQGQLLQNFIEHGADTVVGKFGAVMAGTIANAQEMVFALAKQLGGVVAEDFSIILDPGKFYGTTPTVPKPTPPSVETPRPTLPSTPSTGGGTGSSGTTTPTGPQIGVNIANMSVTISGNYADPAQAGTAAGLAFGEALAEELRRRGITRV